MSQESEAPPKAPPKALPKTMRLEEVAARLGCSFQTVRRRADKGYLHPVKRNNRLEFDTEEVEHLHANPPQDGRQARRQNTTAVVF